MIRRPPTSLTLRPEEITSFRTRMAERKESAAANASAKAKTDAAANTERQKESGRQAAVDAPADRKAREAATTGMGAGTNMVAQNRDERRGLDPRERIGMGS